MRYAFIFSLLFIIIVLLAAARYKVNCSTTSDDKEENITLDSRIEKAIVNNSDRLVTSDNSNNVENKKFTIEGPEKVELFPTSLEKVFTKSNAIVQLGFLFMCSLMIMFFIWGIACLISMIRPVEYAETVMSNRFLYLLFGWIINEETMDMVNDGANNNDNRPPSLPITTIHEAKGDVDLVEGVDELPVRHLQSLLGKDPTESNSLQSRCNPFIIMVSSLSVFLVGFGLF